MIPTDPTDEQVARLMDVVDSRRVLHVGYGAILEKFGPRMYQVWNDHEDELYGIIAEHFVKHRGGVRSHRTCERICAHADRSVRQIRARSISVKLVAPGFRLTNLTAPR